MCYFIVDLLWEVGIFLSFFVLGICIESLDFVEFSIGDDLGNFE